MWRFKKKGFFATAQLRRRIQRYLCQHCGRSFSSQTFRPDYWLRRGELLPRVFHRSLGCSALRQIAREFGVAHSTIQRHLERLGRHCLLFHERLRPRAPAEPLVLDGFRTLESGHYWPFDLNLLVGPSHYIYAFNDAELRRSGSMRPGQRRHRARLEARFGRPDPQATRKAVAELVGRVVPPDHAVELFSDEHTGYPQALERLPRRWIQHRTTSSKVARTSRNPLFPVNLADLLLRHCGANHKRETIAFSKRRQAALYRAAIFVVWRNYIKPVSENRRTPPPGVTLGTLEAPIDVDGLLAKRLFPWRQSLRGWLRRCYFSEIRTRCLAKNRVHGLAYAV
ncbi:MAG: IS1 family transposase [Myxococcales bacterium]|nr:IS1 family transposase [Myxococcales bacterium]